MWACVYAAQNAHQETSSLVASGARSVINLVAVMLVAGYRRELRDLFTNTSAALWARGIFGSTAMISTFASIKYIGVGESAFLRSGNSVFIALLSPFILKQRVGRIAWIAILGSLAGMYLMAAPRVEDGSNFGRTLALISALMSACAYLMIAYAGRTNQANKVIFYLCLVSTVTHAVLLTILPDPKAPADIEYWLYVGASGLFAAGAQHFMTEGYRLAPAALNAAVSYVNPVFNLLLGLALFGDMPDQNGLLGAALILVFGVSLPFLTHVKKSPTP
jgi:S-adenosylmethionine uptake transporter